MKLKVKNKKVTSKKLLIILLFLILIIIGLLCLYIMILQSDSGSSYEQYQYIYESDVGLSQGESFPQNFTEFYSRYGGNLSKSTICKSLYYVSNTTIPKYYADLKSSDDAQIEEYYNTNKESINMNIGAITIENFKIFINKIKELKADSLVFESYSIDEATLGTESIKKCNLKITYSGCDELTINVTFKDSSTENISKILYK